MTKKLLKLFALSFILLSVGVVNTFLWYQSRGIVDFNAERAYQDVIFQTSLGARTPGSEAHVRVIQYISDELQSAGWQVELQNGEKLGHTVTNIIAKRGDGSGLTILGAHYDSRLIADRDPNPYQRNNPVPGANDGASGVAVLLELARTLPRELNNEVWLVFFDLEDQGNIEGWDWILGSRFFVQNLDNPPDNVVIVDMVGDADLKIFRERNSDPGLTKEIWSLAAEMGYENHFIIEPKYSILDDHTPFLERGIKAIDIIDFDYPYWHTVSDTADKVSPQSLEIVGRILSAWVTR